MKTCMFTGMFRRERFETAIENAAKIGYDAVEIRYAPDHFPPELTDSEIRARGAHIRALGLEVAEIYGFAGGFSMKSDEECEKQLPLFARLLEVADMLGTDLVKIECGGPNAFLAKPWHFEKSAYYIARLARMAKDASMCIALEIHNGSLIEDVSHALAFLDQIGADNVGFIHDAGNMYITGEDYGEASVRWLGRHLFHVHVKDVLRVQDASLSDTFANRTKNGEELFRLTPLGEGGADHAPLIRALKRAGYTGYLSTEANLSMDAMEMTLHEYKALRRLMDEV